MDDEQMIAPPLLPDSVRAKVPRRPQEPPSEQDLAAARAYCGLLRTLRDGIISMLMSRFYEGGLEDDSHPTLLQEMLDATRFSGRGGQKIRETPSALIERFYSPDIGNTDINSST
ncbi:hypothetical protein V1520DRAFT_328500 [Lipomyces starkeyi]